MTYAETLQYLYAQSPDFQEAGKRAYKPGLDNTLRLDERLGHPHRRFTSVHVAGTNGKGSTSHLIAAVLQNAGYKVGLYTSPHLIDFRERIRVNGREIPEQYVAGFAEMHKATVESIHPSFFELTMMMAFEFFAQEKVDAAVVEVGLGGRLDSTNVITPALSIITNIGLDHTDLLGDTLEKIAREKAGIIKPGVPVVVGEYQPEVAHIFEQKAAECSSPLVFANRQRSSADTAKYELDLYGDYQQRNLCTAIAALDCLQERGVFSFYPKNMEEGFRTAATVTGLRGRWEQLCANPKIICDTAHNAHGLQQTMAQLAHTACGQLHIVFGMVADKDISGAVALLPRSARYYFTQADIPRALPVGALAGKCRAAGLQGEEYPTVAQALRAAKANAAANDIVYVGGSTFVVADALKAYALFEK
ncbi:MAG: bifunctional folylpolyglutamate synthase/dihydrofolate synthase [Prevotellaceae bacterium]|jgi:dihydrofolate synthase/folylpolyglutamate synthase|nr:bifunctional folylpolyglutamate synthase/dihydrofolate synthase [Prevotellaceae bacterium]